uniref:Uncharacterized protein n=1 Tax=viral metagenome TaxID=1070528 RepID=A0A6M3IV81_9ZZZZ
MTTEEAKKICKLIGCSGISPELYKDHPEAQGYSQNVGVRCGTCGECALSDRG